MDETKKFLCPRIRKDVECSFAMDPVTFEYQKVERCSALEGSNPPECHEECVNYLNVATMLDYAD